MNKKHWLDCAPSLTHGNIVQRVIFTQRDSKTATAEGAILNHVDSFARGCLAAGATSAPHINKGFQEVFFVAAGSGTLIAAGKNHALREGDGILIPPAVKHSFVNNDCSPLELLILVESIPAGLATTNTEILIRNYRQSPIVQAHWHHFSQSIFNQKDGLTELHSILIVRMEPMTTADMHSHESDMDEIWYMWKGAGMHVVSRDVSLQSPGTALAVAPCNPGHMLINHTNEPLEAFYFAHYV
jgi:mannose-6-phosphate isomerase-like protein (cupin superfamily)